MKTKFPNGRNCTLVVYSSVFFGEISNYTKGLVIKILAKAEAVDDLRTSNLY